MYTCSNMSCNITGSAVALHCCKARAKINRKMGNSTPCKIVTPENIILKLFTRTSATWPSIQILVSIGTVGASPQRGELLSPYDVFDCPILPCPVLSCLVLSLPFFSMLRPGQTAWTIFTLYSSNDVFPPKNSPLGFRTMGDQIWRKYVPKTPQNGHE